MIALRELTEELRRVQENGKMHLDNGESLQMFRCQEDDYKMELGPAQLEMLPKDCRLWQQDHCRWGWSPCCTLPPQKHLLRSS